MSGTIGFFEIFDQFFLIAALIFLRIGPIMILVPGIGESYVPARSRLFIAMIFSFFLAPILTSSITVQSINQFSLTWLILSETTVGFIFGIGVRVLLFALQTAGSIAAQATSLSMIIGNSGITPLPAMGHLLVISALCLFMLLGLHVKIAETIVLSYDLFPISQFPSPPDVTMWGIRQISASFALAFTLSAPFLIVSMLYNVTLGVVNKAMPQMMVVFVGAPVITFSGILMLFFLAPSIILLWVRAIDRFLTNPTLHF